MVARIGNPPSPVVPARTADTIAPSKPAPAASTAVPSWQPKMVDVDNAPRRTEMRMPKNEASTSAQEQMPIACPVLKALVVEGKMKVDPEGRVQTNEMLAALKERGLTRPMLETLRAISYFANEPKDVPRNVVDQSFNVMHLRSGLTMHNADSNVLSRGAFDEAAFDRFTAHANNGWMDKDAFAAAIATQTKGDLHAQNPLVAATFGKNAVLAEYPVLLKLFGTKDPSGKPAIEVGALKAFWKDGTLPANTNAAGSVGMLDTAKLYASMLVKADTKLVTDAFKGLFTATGLANNGLRLSRASEAASGVMGMASGGAGKAANCPHLKGGGKPMQTPLEGNLVVHQ